MSIKTWKLFLYRPLVYYTFRRKSSLGLWNEDITTEIKHKIEKHWANEVLSNTNDERKDTYYVLPMFPYPSGNLHMGHVRVYSISDTIARFHKLDGKNVIHPIGWDAFGLPAENAAIERKILPQVWTNTNISTMKEQLVQLGFNFDWEREISTCDPKYYKWTQYIFLKLFENGLAYQNKAKVNWDPVDQTVLADEQVDDNGCSWRSGAKVEKKTLTQWFIRTTKLARQLYTGLDSKNLENWKDIINLQKHWIGECTGIVVNFHIKLRNKQRDFDVWSPDPYKFIHGEYLILSKDNVLVNDILPEEINSIKCFNPLTNKEMPIYIIDSLLYPEGRDVYIACPSVDSQDYNLSLSLNIPTLNNQSIDIDSENKRATKIAHEKGGYFVSSKLKDWLISRQRFWGTPIPIIHCHRCGAVPVPYEELPVTLPDNNSQESKISTLSNFESWVNCKCPKCSGTARRESDTMDTFVDSSWYYYRFLDPKNDEKPFDKEKLEGITPVNCYIGGKEHAVLHLYYARFISYFLQSLGLTPSQEPFKKLLVQGMIMGQSYRAKSSGKYLPPEDVEMVDKEYIEKSTGEPVLVQWEKMSKSKYNGENPQRLLSTYGCDTTRLLMLSDVPPATSRKWTDATLPGVLNFQHRLWITIRDLLIHRQNIELMNSKVLTDKQIEEFETKLWNSRNYFIATATFHFKFTHKLSVGISRLQGLTNALRNNIPLEIIVRSKEYEKSLASLIIMLSIVTPHFCSELWAGLQSVPHKLSKAPDIDWSKEVLQQRWPIVDKNYPLSFQCKVDGADRCELKIEAEDLRNLKQENALQMMIKEKPVAERIKRGILKTKYELYPDCRAILNIFTNRHTNTKDKTKSEIEPCRLKA